MKKVNIKKFEEDDIGKWVWYQSDFNNEKGKLKKFDNEKRLAWVVYNCNENWDLDHWKDYTAEATNYEHLFWESK